MEINVTAVERNIRLYGVPGLITLVGMVGVLLIDPTAGSTNQFEQLIAPVKKGIFLGAAAFALGGMVWALYRAWLEFRWMQGDSVGGCGDCGGVMRHLDGRYGAYSKCLMCGRKQNGWH